MEAFAIYNEDKETYLTGGTFNDLDYSGLPNPLLAHVYAKEEIAERQAKTIMSQYAKYNPTKILPALTIHKISDPTITASPTGIIQPNDKVTGYSIEFRITPNGDESGGYQRQPYTEYIRNQNSMISRVCDNTDYYYGKLNHILARNAKPAIWKTKVHVEKLLAQLQTVMDSNISEYCTYEAKVVKISV